MEIRTRRKFCLFPFWFDDTYYWLETVVLTERFDTGTWASGAEWEVMGVSPLELPRVK